MEASLAKISGRAGSDCRRDNMGGGIGMKTDSVPLSSRSDSDSDRTPLLTTLGSKRFKSTGDGNSATNVKHKENIAKFP